MRKHPSFGDVRDGVRRLVRRCRDRMMRPRPALLLGWMVMVVVVASDGLTLLSAVSFISHSVPLRAQDLLNREQRLVQVAIMHGDPARTLAERIDALGRGFAGRLALLPALPGGGIDGDTAAEFLAPDVAGRLATLSRPIFRQVHLNGERWFVLYSPIDRLGAVPGLERGVLVLATPRAPLEREAQTEREGLIGTALLTLVLLGYALVGVSQWLGTQLEGREARLAIAKGELELALAHMSDGLCVFDRNDRVTVFNRQFCEILGLPHGSVRRGASFDDLLAASLAVGNHPGRDAAEVTEEQRAFVAARQPVKVHHETHDGRTIEVEYSPTAESGWLLTCADVSERLRAHSEIAYMAEHDALTGLLNRAALANHLAKQVALATPDHPVVLLCLDLDHFKEVNDRWGHPAGDRLLRTVADRLQSSLRQGDDAAYRLGGDEFAVLLTGVDPMAAGAAARRILRTINQPVDVADAPHAPRVSIGLAVAPDDACEPDRLLKCADLALYAAKASGRNALRRFTAALEQPTTGHAITERTLLDALTARRFELWYRPVLSLPTRRLAEFEALPRWNDPQRGLVAPEASAGVMELAQGIPRICTWVIGQACADAAPWPGAVRIVVNLTPGQLHRRELAVVVERVLRRSGIAPQRLELAVLETAIVHDPPLAFAALGAVQRLGVRVALDGLGTSHASLNVLTQFRFDSIRIGRSFIEDLAQRRDRAAIADALSALGTPLRLMAAADGNEVAEQLRRAGELGCLRVQGFVLGPPLRAVAARHLAWSHEHTVVAA